MKTFIARIWVLVTMLIVPVILYADSPITSTPFFEAYLDHEIVRVATREGVVSSEIAEFLSSPDNPIDLKAAVVNALSWDVEGKDNGSLYLNFLAAGRNKAVMDLKMEELTSDEIFCLGYMAAMDDYFRPELALPIIQRAHELNSTSFTVAIIMALVKAQDVMDKDFCRVWLVVEEVLDLETAGQITDDMRPEARKIILGYMSGYKKYCEEGEDKH